MRRLPSGIVIDNQVGGVSYRIESLLGAGGFGAAYRARRLNRSGGEVEPAVCLKFFDSAAVWHGEAYFANLLSGATNVVKQRDAFPTSIVQGRGRRLVFVIEMELIETGTVRDACADGRLPWPEERVARKTRGLLRALALLHRSGTSHRDITPPNVYLANRAVLKLGDFGITKTGLLRSGVRVDALNEDFAPRDLGAFWRPADDVYQVGLLMLTLLSGEEMTNEVGKVAVNHCTSPEGILRPAIKAALSVRSRRPRTSDEFLALLDG